VPGNPSTDPWQWVMADYLSRRGIVVLRVDDRGTGHSSGDYATSTIEALSNDALAGIQFLRSHPQVDSGRVGLLGLSEGALVAQIAAADSPSLTRHVVLLGGPGIPGDANFLEQARRLAIPTRRPQERAAEERRLVAKAWIRQLAKSDVDEEAIRAEVRAWNAGSSEPVNAKVLESMLNSALTPIVRSEIRFDPARVLPRVKAPILALNGAADLWVNADSNLPAIRRAAEAGGNREVVVRRLEGLDHALRPAPGDKPGREEFDIDEQVLAMIAGWILDH
jgi:pimeloyl-ACP methyl ester carboxylesterase